MVSRGWGIYRPMGRPHDWLIPSSINPLPRDDWLVGRFPIGPGVKEVEQVGEGSAAAVQPRMGAPL